MLPDLKKLIIRGDWESIHAKTKIQLFKMRKIHAVKGYENVTKIKRYILGD